MSRAGSSDLGQTGGRLFPVRPALALGVLFLLGWIPAQAAPGGVIAGLAVEPAIVQEDGDKTVVTTRVTLQRPSPDYFICQVRSEKRDVACSTLIFKKGDTEATGTATIFWPQVQMDSTVKLTAFNVEAPDKVVTAEITLQKKTDQNP